MRARALLKQEMADIFAREPRADVAANGNIDSDNMGDDDGKRIVLNGLHHFVKLMNIRHTEARLNAAMANLERNTAARQKTDEEELADYESEPPASVRHMIVMIVVSNE